MASISNLFKSDFQKRNQDHFASIVKIAMSDGVITIEEKEFLDRLAINLNITSEAYKNILDSYETHPINPPTSYEKRLERLFDLSRMVYADHLKANEQVILLEKLSVGLGFKPENVKYIVDKALILIEREVDSEEFYKEMRNMNQ